MVSYRKPNESKKEYFAMVKKEDILNKNLTDAEFRVYSYYLSNHISYSISMTKIAQNFKGLKTRRTLEEIQKSLIKKGFLAIVGKRDPHYYVGEAEVNQCYQDNKTYFEDKAKKSKIMSNRMKETSPLTEENRLKGSNKKIE